MRLRSRFKSILCLVLFGGWAVVLSAQDCDPSQDLSCISQLNVTFDDQCQATLTPAILLSGDDACIEATDFLIEVNDLEPANGAVVDGCGEFTYSIRELTAPDDDSPPLQCWGTLTAYDGASPVLFALPQVGGTLFCDDLLSADINQLPANVSRCWLAEGATGQPVPGSLDPALRQRLDLAGGLPNFRDACSRVEICVTDQVFSSGNCSDQSILRRFTARDGIDCPSAPGQENEATLGFQTIVFSRPGLEDIEDIAPTAVFECDADFPLLAPNQYGVRNPVPRQTDYPFFAGVNGPVYLNDPFCNIGTTFEDGPRLLTCPETYRFARTYTVIDWCEAGAIETYTQLVKVGDFEAPTIGRPVQDLDFDGEPDELPLFFTTNQAGCSANFLLPAADLTDNCDTEPSYRAYILPMGNPNVAPLGPYAENDVVLDIPAGEHLLRYVAIDACDNADTLDLPILIGDRNPPLAICEDGLDISLNGFGEAILFPEAIDANSRDDCSDQLLLEVSRLDDNEQPIGGWLEQITLTCGDLGVQAVALRVTDAADNQNACWLNVLVEDKIAPICSPPSSLNANCDDQTILDLPADLAAAFADEPTGTAAQLDATFGEASGIDNCALDTVTQTVTDVRNACGVGLIIRNFMAVDAGGLSSGNVVCQQFITVAGLHDYSLRLPADASSELCLEPDYNELVFAERGCDLITSTTRLDTFAATADECYKLRITYEVINWCEYGTEQDPYLIPRDADNDDLLEEETWLHVLPRDETSVTDDIAYLDQDENRFNGFISPLDADDPGGQVPGASQAPYGQDASRGAFLYRQFVKIYDDTPPVFQLPTLGPIADLDGDCEEEVSFTIFIGDACTAPESFGVNPQFDLFFSDQDGDDTLTLADFQYVGPANDPLVLYEGAGSFRLNFPNALPLGRHALRILASDGCGNMNTELLIFTIEDRKAPTPICINGLTATLMPGGENGAMAEVWASEFLASQTDDCTGPVGLSIYRSSEADSSGFSGPQPSSDTVLTLDCADQGMLMVRVYTTDAAGNSDYCETVVSVQAFQPNICPEEGGGNLFGRIAVESDLPMPNVDVTVSNSQMSEIELTDGQGRYLIDGLEEGQDYTVQPRNDELPLNGVTTIDILAITYHLIGDVPLTSPYQLIAADVDDSGIITVSDLVAIRMLILGLTNNFEGNTSWRFVDADYDFPDPTDPWVEEFPTVANFNDLEGAAGADFVAIKTGDVNGSALLGLQGPDEEFRGLGEPRSGRSLVLSPVENLPANEVVEVPLYVSETAGIATLQGTWELSDGVELLEIIPGLAGPEHFGTSMLERGWLTMAYYQPTPIASDLPLATLKISAPRNMSLGEALRLGNAFTPALAYAPGGETFDLALSDDTMPRHGGLRNCLYPIVPNPLRTSGYVAFELDRDQRVHIEVLDATGRTVHRMPLNGQAGYNRMPVQRDQLRAPAGLYYVRLSGSGFSAVQSLVLN